MEVRLGTSKRLIPACFRDAAAIRDECGPADLKRRAIGS
jgi:hypothetical protein